MTTPDALSLFALLQERIPDLKPIQATKATLVDVSHILEELVLSERAPALIFTGFQESSYWRRETARYRELAGVAHQICIFAGGELPRESDHAHIHVRLHGPDPLRQEWFLLVMTERMAALLCGRDRQQPAGSEADRSFDTLWSVEPEIIAATLDLLRQVVARERPDRLADLQAAAARFPPPPPDARLMTLLTARLIDDLVRQHQARLRVERTLAYESRLRSLGQVISGVAHELNNPLQSVLGFAAMLQDDLSLPPVAREDLRHILEAAERARAIVQNLLQLSRPTSNGQTLVDLGALISQTLVFVRSDLNAAGVTLSVDVAPGTSAIQADAVRVQQLLINLMVNAAHALAEWPPPRLLTVRAASPDPSTVVLSVIDNGPGIPRELHDRIFEPFFTTKPVGKGTGLGLSIVRTIVAEHAGTLHLDSAPGAGTTFTIRLPVLPARDSEGEPDAPGAGKGRVLLVDDDPQVRRLVQRVMERGGFVVTAVDNAARALDLLLRQRFAAVVCDVLMPEMDGMQFYERLAERRPELTRRIIFITGDASRPATQVFLQGIGTPALTKPFTPADLLRALEEVLPDEG